MNQNLLQRMKRSDDDYVNFWKFSIKMNEMKNRESIIENLVLDI